MSALCAVLLMSAVWGLRAQEEVEVCRRCRGVLRNDSEVSLLCRNTSGAELVGRCCVEPPGGGIIGLDLWNCSLARLDPELRLTAAIMVMDLSQNPLQELPHDVFKGLIRLRYIALPGSVSCPGGDEFWGEVKTRSGDRICRDQRSACNTTGDWTVLCPENSVCAADGPGYTQCVCTAPFSGYKCLREGSFPTLLFFGILSSVTVSLSVLLWCTQRRKVKSL
ncbi:all-trans retinoic acid-induced differentiation factor [Mantella aurantiaca]